MKSNGLATIPSLRAHMGTWVYYITTMTFKDIKDRVKKTEEIHKSEKLREMIQRALTDRSKEISDYLLTQPQRFFNAIVVGIYGGEPEWYPINIQDNPGNKTPNLSDRTKKSVGLLKLSGNEKIFAIDGQHRVEAIKYAIEREQSLSTEELCVIFVGHKTDDTGRERTRRLFTTLNKHAKAVLPGEIVALDEDDVFAIVTRQLVEDYKPLSGERVLFSKTPPIPPNDKKSMTTILTLFKLTEILSAPPRQTKSEKLEYRKLRRIRPPDDVIGRIYKDQTHFWEALRNNVPAIKKVTNSDPMKKLAGRYRTDDGGLVLFRPAGQIAFVMAVRSLRDRGKSIEAAVKMLSRREHYLNSSPWVGVLWDPVRERMIRSVNYRLAQNLFLRLAGQNLDPTDYDLQEEYRKALRDEDADVEQDLQN